MKNNETKGVVLVVDDQLDNLRLLSQLLSERGYSVRAAKTGIEALSSIKSALPDLVLLDIRLPDISGYEVCARLKSSEATRDLPVLFLSALKETDEILRGFAVGAVDYIAKPFQAEEVLARVKINVEMKQIRAIIDQNTVDLRFANDQIQIELAERKRVETSLRKSESALMEAQRVAHIGNWHWDAMTDVIWWSEELYRIYNKNPGSQPPKYEEDQKNYTPESAAQLTTVVDKAVQTGEPYKIVLELNSNAGPRRWVEARGEAICDASGQIVGLRGTVQDITDRKQAEAEKAELVAQNQQLQKSESLGRMAGAIAHHFNNQLYAMMGNLEMAMDDLPRGADISETLAEALQAARKSAEVSRLMLTYLGQTPGNQEPIDMSEACRQSLTLLQAAAPKGALINADFPSSGPVIRADTNQMHQILTNLVTNAWESIADNRGTIGLTVKTVSHEDIPTSKRFPIDWQPLNPVYACLEVSDTGCGIANKDIEKLFDPFFTTKFTGRGLGLPVVIGIVKAHGGGVTVESEPGRGSVFRIFFPVSTEELPIQHDLPAMPEALLTGKAAKSSKIESGGTVLLIEDEDSVRNMAKKMLTCLGYVVIEAKDGVEAVDVFKQHQNEILCVLSDLTMPRMNGWETLAALRKLSPDIPVILSSGYDKAKVMAEEHTEIPSAFLGKPYQLKGLRETISRVLADQK
jgi:CheY-like chemotaxis protein